jgi:hypothetical protein
MKFSKRCPVMNVIGDHSPHDDDAVETNGRLNPADSTLLKVLWTKYCNSSAWLTFGLLF